MKRRHNFLSRIFSVLLALIFLFSNSAQAFHALRPVSPTETQDKPYHIYNFGLSKADGNKDMVFTLGIKGANLAEMSRIGVPVPPGFTIPHKKADKLAKLNIDEPFPEDIALILRDGVREIERRYEQMTNDARKFGNPDNPLLLAVRSGAEVSIPGAFITRTHVGLCRETLEGYARQIGDRLAAYNDYAQYMLEYDMDRIVCIGEFNAIYGEGFTTIEEAERGIRQMEQIWEESYDKPFPEPWEQLYENIIIVALYNPEDIFTRVPDLLVKPVNVQAYVYGNSAKPNSFSGVVFSRNPYDGSRALCGTVAFHTKGRDIVTPFERSSVQKKLPDVPIDLGNVRSQCPSLYGQIEDWARFIERHFKIMQDYEVVCENGRLWFVQTRNNIDCMTPRAQIITLLNMVEEGIIDEDRAFEKVDLEDLKFVYDFYLSPVVKKETQKTAITRGIPVSCGVRTGPAYVFGGNLAVYLPEELREKKIFILDTPVAYTYEDRLASNLKGIAGAVSTGGSFSDHIAQVMRKNGLYFPYVINPLLITETGELGAKVEYTELVGNGELITVDGNTGYIYAGKLTPEDFEPSGVSKVVDGLLEPADCPDYKYFLNVYEWIELKEKGLTLQPAQPAKTAEEIIADMLDTGA